MSIKLHCNDCNNDYDSILDIEDLDAAVCPRCGGFGSSVPVVPDVKETQEEALTPPPPAAPVANPREVENRSEAPRKTREGHSSTPPSETSSGRNVEGRFSARFPKKPLLIGTAALILLIIACGITWVVMKGPGTSSGVDVVIETETVQTPEKKAEEEKQTESQTPTPAPEKPAPAPKVVRKTPKASSLAPKASAPSNTPWRYRVETPAPKQAPPQPRAQAKNPGNPLGKLFKVFDGPAPDVTPAPAPNDPRGSGM